MNSTKEYRKLHGLCYNCGDKRDDLNKTRCAPCRTKDAEAAKARGQKKRAIWKAEGLCAKCGSPREDTSFTKCQRCRTRDAREARDKHSKGESTRARRIKAGLCYDCSVDISDQKSGIRCPECQNKNAGARRDLTKRKAAEGTCCYCPEPALPGKILCASCAGKNATRNADAKDKRQEAGLCRWCPTEATHESTACAYHFVYNLLKNWGRAPTSDEVDAVWTKLEDQGFECFYTGMPLVPGINASIEHIFPRKRYPDDVWTMENLAWCDLRINRLKGDMTPEELGEFVNRMQDRLPKILAVRLPNRE